MMQRDLGSTAEGGIAPGEGMARVRGEPGSGFYFGQDCMKACMKCPV